EEAIMAAGWEHVHLLPEPVTRLVTVVHGLSAMPCGSLLGMQPIGVRTAIHPLPFSHVTLQIGARRSCFGGYSQPCLRRPLRIKRFLHIAQHIAQEREQLLRGGEACYLAGDQMLDTTFPRQRAICTLGAKLDHKGPVSR